MAEAYGYAERTQHPNNFMEQLGIGQAHLAGSSMGGTIAALFSIRYPELVASVALTGAQHGLRTPKPSEMDALIDARKSPLIAHNAAQFEQIMAVVFSR